MLLYILGGVIVSILFIGWYISFKTFHPQTLLYRDTLKREIEKGHINQSYLSKYTIDNVSIQSGTLTLSADYIDQGAKKTLLIMHGYTYTRHGSYKYAPMFLEKGYNILMPDQRFHGLSEGSMTTLGLKESDDCKKWIDYIHQKTPQVSEIGLHGESMGAATVLHAAKDNDDIAFVISDCAFSDFKKQVEYVLKTRNKLPKKMVYVAEIFAKMFRTTILKNRPVDAIQNIKCPILLIHGQDDSFITLDHFKDLKERLKKQDQTYVCPEADHAMSYETNPKQYEHVVNNFLTSITK